MLSFARTVLLLACAHLLIIAVSFAAFAEDGDSPNAVMESSCKSIHEIQAIGIMSGVVRSILLEFPSDAGLGLMMVYITGVVEIFEDGTPGGEQFCSRRFVTPVEYHRIMVTIEDGEAERDPGLAPNADEQSL